MTKKTVQTSVDEEYAEAFDQWANDKYGSKAAALRDFVKTAPTGESVHSTVTNADLEDQIADLRDTIESGSFSGHQQNQQNSAESDEEDMDLIEMYDPDVDAEELPAEITPEHEDVACIRKDILEQIVEDWEETGSVPDLNPTHISSDNRPQGGDTTVALGIAIIQHRLEKKIRHSSIVDVLASDNGGLGYTEQYVKENGHAHDIAGHLVPVPGEDSVYIVDDGAKDAALAQTEQDIENEVQALADKQKWQTFDSAKRKINSLLEDLNAIEDNMGVDSAISEDDISEEIVAAGREINQSLFNDKLNAAHDVVDDFEERLDEMKSAESYEDYAAADPDQDRRIITRSKAEEPANHHNRYGSVTTTEFEEAEAVQDRYEELIEEMKRVEDEKEEMVIESEKLGVDRRELGVKHLVDIARQRGDLEVAESAVEAIDDLHACKYSSTRQSYADLTIDVDYQSLRSRLTRDFRGIESRDWGLWG